MTQAISTSLTFEEFVNRYGDDYQYELIDGELIDLEPTGYHEQVVAFIGRKLNVEIDLLERSASADRENMSLFIPHRCLIKPLGTDIAFRPDVIVLDQTALEKEPLWQREPIVTIGASIKLVVEVASTNWQNDYARKAEDYALLGIPEYWIVDYLGLGGREYIGKPKQPTITVCTLIEEEYPRQLFRGDDYLISSIFPNLQLNAKQIFAAGQ